MSEGRLDALATQAVPGREAPPKDPRLILALTFHRLGSTLFESVRAAKGDSAETSFSRLSDSQQAAVQENLARFEQLGGNDDHALAAAA